MSRYRFGRTYTDKSISTSKIAQQERDDILADMDALLYRRLYMNRLEVEVDQVFHRAVPQHIVNALEVLEADPFWKSSLNRTGAGGWATLLVNHPLAGTGSDESKPIGGIKFEVKEAVPAVYYRYTDGRVATRDMPEYELLLAHCRNQYRVTAENAYSTAALRDFLNACNTWGQTVRIWPAFTNYIIHEGKRARVESQSKTSPLPVELRDDPKKLERLQARLNFTEQVLVQALMLPPMDPRKRRTEPAWHYDTDYWGEDIGVNGPE